MIDPARCIDQQFLNECGQIGDCVRASVATLLGLSAAEVPHFVEAKDWNGKPEVNHDWQHDLERWLQARDETMLELDPRLGPRCLYLASGPTLRSRDASALHMVVMFGPGHTLVHDPHPSRAGLLGVTSVRLIIPRRF